MCRAVETNLIQISVFAENNNFISLICIAQELSLDCATTNKKADWIN